MLELWGMWSTRSFPSLLDPLWPEVVATDRILFMGQIELNRVITLNWIVWNRTVYLYKVWVGPLHIDEKSLDDKLEPIYNSSLLIQDVVWKTSRERWTIETGGERGPGRSVLAAWHGDDDNDDMYKMALNNRQWLICHETQPNQIIYI